MINLLFTGNDKIFEGLSIALISIVKHCKEPLNVVVLTMDLSNQNETYKSLEQHKVDLLENYLKTINAKSKITLVDITDLFQELNKDSVNMNNKYSPYAFIRLLADKVVEIEGKVLYLDIDVVANGNIKDLYEQDIGEYEFGAVRDYYGRIFIHRNYVNSGVMLLNMEKIRETGLFERARKLVNTKKMAFPDQTALNKVARFTKYLPAKYNSQKKLKDDDILRHFCKSIKWYPNFMRKSNPNKQYCEPFKPWFRLFHTVNVKPWNKDGMHNMLNCHAFDDVIDLKENLIEKLKEKENQPSNSVGQ